MRRNPPRFPDAPASLPPNLAYVLSIPPSVWTLGLGNIHALLEALGHPERAFRSVVVAGTNGKGSVTGFLAALLAGNGQSVGWYSSPHVHYVSERVRLGVEPVTVEHMEAAASRIVPLHDRIPFSYFEALTAIAFLVFAEAGVDIAVLETGLGGRFDATNAVDGTVTILTSVSLDHRRILGDTEEEILREKLGITRPGVPLLVGPVSDALRPTLEERCRRARVPVIEARTRGGAEVEAMTFDGMRLRVHTERKDYGEVKLPFCGHHQPANFLLALIAAEYLLPDVDRIDESLARLYIPGRFEVHRIAGKTVVLDVAHNDAALMATAGTLATLSPPEDNAMILGLLERKELLQFPALIGEWVKRVHFIDPVPGETVPSPAFLGRFGMASLGRAGFETVVEGPLKEKRRWDRVLGYLFGAANPYPSLLVTGSFRTVEVVGRELADRGMI